ncbi:MULTISPECIES: peptidylprolyl isomerase [unclassified Ectothiorhodospira]|uniref:FKBP-type peptidyl-prolyl cis-trans isomerase n=1 Tax=unclassified Ectothiorhodospira TaxID=2684909 RepID=UPI001EE7B921|nr:MULTISPECIES: peptidylprolyl isomerase [unclassified Ectothiorhodospira]MCG5515725.1 peptidylprolyl isomerase [Ectothiorhodospira sp. 9100]MCG5519992.1 peptidylprolyl isomerase [Ectothiorhodospira sp. 9905]
MITAGSRVRMHYTITLENGQVADSTREDPVEPVEFTVGQGELHGALEGLVTALSEGESCTTTLPPEQAFGFATAQAVQTMERSDFPEAMPLEPGLLVGFDTPTGEQIPGLIRKIEGDRVIVDFNHPLAGHTITVEIEVLSVETPS